MSNNPQNSKFDTVKRWALGMAEVIDAWRVVPRLFLVCYGILMYKIVIWFYALPTYEKRECDSAVIQILLDSNIDLVKAQEFACTVIDVVGGPTTAQAAFATTIISLSTAIFAFYANTGRSWDKDSMRIEN